METTCFFSFFPFLRAKCLPWVWFPSYGRSGILVDIRWLFGGWFFFLSEYFFVATHNGGETWGCVGAGDEMAGNF